MRKRTFSGLAPPNQCDQIFESSCQQKFPNKYPKVLSTCWDILKTIAATFGKFGLPYVATFGHTAAPIANLN